MDYADKTHCSTSPAAFVIVSVQRTVAVGLMKSDERGVKGFCGLMVCPKETDSFLFLHFMSTFSHRLSLLGQFLTVCGHFVFLVIFGTVLCLILVVCVF